MYSHHEQFIEEISEYMDKVHIINFQEVFKFNTKIKFPFENFQKMVYRFRKSGTPHYLKRGGISTLVRNGTSFRTLDTFSYTNDTLEILTCKIESGPFKGLNLNVYRNHTDKKAFLKELKDIVCKLKSLFPGENIYIAGDMNFDFQVQNNKLAEQLFQQGFIKITHGITRPQSKTELDAIFATRDDLTFKNFTNSFSDHNIIIAVAKSKKTITEPTYKRLFLQDEIDNFTESIETEIDLGILHCGDAKSAFDYFDNKVEQCYVKSFPFHKINERKPKKPYMTKGLLKSRITKRKLLRKYQKSPTNQNKQQLNAYCKIYYKLISKSKSLYYGNKLAENASNSKAQWNTLRQLTNLENKKDKPDISLIEFEGKEYTDKVDICNVINNFFTNIGPNLASKIKGQKNFREYLNKLDKPNSTMKLREMANLEIRNIIKASKPKSSSGIDGISSKLLKQTMDSFTESLTILINRSFTEAYIPKSWKTAKVLPLYKGSGPIEDPSSLRPISLLSAFSKILEKCARFQLTNYLKSHNLQYHRQYGFKKSYQTSDLLANLIDSIASSDKTHTCVFFDIRKCFDCVPTDILLAKMAYLGIDTAWFENYLTDRTQSVHMDGIKSETTNLTCGVPQGSVLGPVLFLIMASDAHTAIDKKANLFTFADDSTLGVVDDSMDRNFTNAQVANFHEWMKSNKLTLNALKTKTMTFNKPRSQNLSPIKIDNVDLEETSSFKLVGVFLDPDLNFNSHVNYVCKKMGLFMHLLARSKQILPMKLKWLFMKSLLLPHIDYCLEIWGNSRSTKKLQTMLNKILRLVLCKRKISHINHEYKKRGILKVEDMYKSAILKQCIKRFTNKTHMKNIFPLKEHTRTTRNNFDLELELRKPKRDKYDRQYVYQLPKLWNTELNKYSHLKLKKAVHEFKWDKINSYKDDPCTVRNCFICNQS